VEDGWVVAADGKKVLFENVAPGIRFHVAEVSLVLSHRPAVVKRAHATVANLDRRGVNSAGLLCSFDVELDRVLPARGWDDGEGKMPIRSADFPGERSAVLGHDHADRIAQLWLTEDDLEVILLRRLVRDDDLRNEAAPRAD